MKYFAFALGVFVVFSSCTSTSTAPSSPSVPTATTTPVEFDSFTIENTTGIKMHVTLEAPIGTPVITAQEVMPGQTAPFVPTARDVSSAKIIADFGEDHGKYTETITLTAQTVPVYIKQLSAAARIGDVTVTTVIGAHPRPQ